MSIKKKICLLGPFACGKSSIINRYVLNVFSDQYLTTIGTHISKKSFYLAHEEDSKKNIDLLIWDLEGGRERAVTPPSYLMGAYAAIIVFDCTRSYTLDLCLEYIELYKKFSKNDRIFIAANKIDVNHNDLLIENAQKKLETNDIFLTSAKLGNGIHELFSQVVSGI